MKKMKLYDYDHLVDFTDVELTPREAIIFKCHECCCFDGKEVKACDSRDCALWKYKEKWYKAPHGKMNLTDEQRQSIKERLMKGRNIEN